MAKGGYQIIDLSKDPFISGRANTVHGAYSKAAMTRGNKAILIEGIRLGASTLTVSTMTASDFTAKNAEWANFTVSDNTATATLSGNVTVAITKQDAVTITQA